VMAPAESHGKTYLLSVQKQGREREARILRVVSLALFGLPTRFLCH
jgi:hypothetical protein